MFCVRHEGKNNGNYKEKQYFEVSKSGQGVFLPLSQVRHMRKITGNEDAGKAGDKRTNALEAVPTYTHMSLVALNKSGHIK
jgi:hypothetical protein